VRDEGGIVVSEKKYYLFREDGEDEGEVALLTDTEYQQTSNRAMEPPPAPTIQSRLDNVFSDGDEAFYIYELCGTTTTQEINKTLDEYLEGEEK
jgi:hypothetical protein